MKDKNDHDQATTSVFPESSIEPGLALTPCLPLRADLRIVWMLEGPSTCQITELMFNFPIDLELRLDSGEHVVPTSLRPGNERGAEARMQTDIEAHGPLDFTLTFREPEPGLIDMSVTTHLDGEKLGAPRIVFALDSPGALLQTQDYALNVEASRDQPNLTAGQQRDTL